MAVCSDMLCQDAPELGMTGRWVCITCLHATLHVIALSNSISTLFAEVDDNSTGHGTLPSYDSGACEVDVPEEDALCSKADALARLD